MCIEFKCIYCGKLEVSCICYSKEDIDYHCIACNRKYHQSLVLKYNNMSKLQKNLFHIFKYFNKGLYGDKFNKD